MKLKINLKEEQIRLNKISILVVGFLVLSLIFSCKKKDDDSNALLLGAAVVAGTSEQAAAEAAGGFSDVPEQCDRTQLDCLKSLIGGKTWYSVGNTQIQRNL